MPQHPFDGLTGVDGELEPLNENLDGINYLTTLQDPGRHWAIGYYLGQMVFYVWNPANNNTTNPESVPGVIESNNNDTGTGAWIMLDFLCDDIVSAAITCESIVASGNISGAAGLFDSVTVTNDILCADITCEDITADSLELSGYSEGGAVFDSGGNLLSRSESQGEAYIFENTTPIDIQAVDQWHPGIGFTAGLLTDWTFLAGAVVDILSFADYSGTVAGTIKATTNGAHGLTTGGVGVVVGANVEAGDANPYYGVYEVTVIDSDEFYFTNPDWNATTTAVLIRPDCLQAGAGAVGRALFNGSGSFSSAGINKTYDIKLFQNTTEIDKVENRITTQQASEWSNIPGNCLLDIVEDDIIWFALKNIDDTTNITVRYANFLIKR